MTEIQHKIAHGDFKNIIICSGAGVSVGAGIPDYRSKDGIFQKFHERYPAYEPSDIFSRSFRNAHPELTTDPEYIKLMNIICESKPTPSHIFAKWLHDKGWLKRVYTQNVDTLYQSAGIDSDLLVEFHGNVNDGIILYGDDISPICLNRLKYDHCDELTNTNQCDLIIVMGTSLQVAPFCAIPNMVNKHCTRILVDINPEGCYTNNWSKVKTSDDLNSSI